MAEIKFWNATLRFTPTLNKYPGKWEM